MRFLEQLEDDQCKELSENIIKMTNATPVCSSELIVVIHTLMGLMKESTSLLECEQYYITALLVMHKLYGDPRGRGAQAVPWELFLTWRLSIVSRL